MPNGNNKIKVLHIITRLIRGGADENTIHTVEGLDTDLFAVDLVVGGQSDPDQMAVLNKARCIMLDKLVRPIHPLYDLLAFVKLCRLLRENNYTIVHTHTAKAGMLGRLAARICGVPIIIHTLHGSTFHSNLHTVANFIYRKLEQWAAKITDIIISVGEDLTARYLNDGVGEKEQYVLIRSGFDLKRFDLTEQQIYEKKLALRKELGIPETDIVISSIARLEPRKGHTFLLDAAHQLLQSRNSVKFVLVGEGSSSHRLKQYCRKIGIDKNVLFLGYRNDIEDVIATSDIIALASLWEGLPRVLVQAASLGKPLISFNTEGAKEVVRDGENGFVVPLKDTRGFSKKLALLVNNPEQAKIMGRKGRRLVGNEWDINYMVASIQELYCKSLEKKNMLPVLEEMV